MAKKILVADDSVVIQKSIGITFAQEDFEVTSVTNGEEAITKAREIKPEIILADTSMPKLAGGEFCKKVRQIPELKFVPILLLASARENFTAEQVKGMGANDFIQKPFESSLLLEKIKSLLSEPATMEIHPGEAEEAFAAYRTSQQPPKTEPDHFSFRNTAEYKFDPRPKAESQSEDFAILPDINEAETIPTFEKKEETNPSYNLGSSELESSPEPATMPQLSEKQIEQIVSRVFQNVIERIAWEVVPEMAERIIRDEIQKLTRD